MEKNTSLDFLELYKLDNQIHYFSNFLLDRIEEIQEVKELSLKNNKKNDYNFLKGKMTAYQEIVYAFNQIFAFILLDKEEGDQHETK